jgi:hypothetical protein
MTRHSTTGPRLMELSVEFDCRMTPVQRDEHGFPDTMLHMGKTLLSWFGRSRLRRVQIVCHPAQGWHPRVHVDGVLLNRGSSQCDNTAQATPQI